ncbi:MAG: hypothetical protein HY719_05130 [Planctomycetes bacterium]|nr:hypothetical protein [Planctomycetota bacterium]
MGDVNAVVDQLRSGLLSPLKESLTLNEMVGAGTKKRDLCRWLSWDGSDLEERLAIQDLPKAIWGDIDHGKLTRAHLHHLLRLNSIFLRYLENRRHDPEEDEFLAFWIKYYQEILGKKYSDRTAEEMKSAVDDIYFRAVGIMERKFGSLPELFLELEALKPGLAGLWARVKKALRRLLKGTSAGKAETSAAARATPAAAAVGSSAVRRPSADALTGALPTTTPSAGAASPGGRPAAGEKAGGAAKP